MAYESFYWRNLIRRDLVYLSKKMKMKHHEVEANIDEHFSYVEIKIMTTAYALRKLADTHKLPDITLNKLVKAQIYRRKVSEPPRAYGDMEKEFDFNTRKAGTIKLRDLCNQIIHSYIFQAMGSRTKAFNSFFVVSDYSRNKYVYEVSLSTFIKATNWAINSYVTNATAKYNTKLGKWIYESKN